MPEDTSDSAQPASNPLDFEPPSLADLSAILEGIDVQSFLGKGALGTVYKALQPKLDRVVALKIFPATVASESSFAARFQREAQTMAKMRHDHIMSVHSFGESTDGAWLYIAMEWVDGDTLERALIKQNWDQARILAVAAQLCDALRYAHGHGVIHRDLKPGNIMLADEGRIKVADFGMAEIVGQESPYDTKLTHSTASIGMPDFVAPEQLEPGTPVDYRADIYSVGVILYKMLTGTIPRGTYRPPSDRNPGIDPRLDAVVARAMEPDPAKRYQDVSELMNELLEIRSSLAPAATPTAPRRGAADNRLKRSGGNLQSVRASGEQDKLAADTVTEKKIATAVMALVGSVALALAILGGVLFFNRDDPEPESTPVIASVPQPKPKPVPAPAPGPPSPAPPQPKPQPAADGTIAPIVSGKSLDLLALVRPAQDRLTGNWKREGRELLNTNPAGQAKLALPARPSGSYRITAAFTRTGGDDSIGFHLPLGDGREVSCFFDHVGTGGEDTSGLEYVDRLDVFNPKNPTRVSPGKLETGRKYTADITVRFEDRNRVTIDALLDGEPHFSFEGSLPRLSIYPGWSQAEKADALGLAVSKSKYTLHELRVDVLDGILAIGRRAPDTAIADIAFTRKSSSEAHDKGARGASGPAPDHPTPPNTPDAPTTPPSPGLTGILAWYRNQPDASVPGLATPPDWLERAVAIAAPDSQAAGILALLEDGKVVAAFDPTRQGEYEPFTNIPADLDNVVAISAGNSHAIALKSDRTVVAWGRPDSPAVQVPSDLDNVAAISAGWGHNLALRADGTVVQWGNRGFGLDKIPSDLTGIDAIAAGGAHCIARREDGSFIAWGRNDFGQADVPGDLGKVVDFKAIAEDSYYLCADGRLEHRGQYEKEIPRNLGNIAAFHVGRGVLAARTRDGDWQFYGININKARAAEKSAGASGIVFTHAFAFTFRGGLAKSSVAMAPPRGAPPPAAAAAHARLQERYDAEVDAAHRRSVAELNAKYRGALERSRQAATGKGDLNEVLALRTEIEALDALEEGLALRKDLPDGAPATLKDFRATYDEQVAPLDAALERAALPVLRAYDRALENLQAKLTRELKIKAALAVKTARETLRESSPFAPGAPGLDTPLRDAGPAANTSASRTAAPLPDKPPELAYPPARPEVAGSVVAWETGTGNPIAKLPEEIADLKDVVAIDTANDIGIALRASGKVAVWGGIAEARTRIPEDLTDVAAVSVGEIFAVALRSDGQVAVWGRDGDHVNVPERLRSVAAVPVGAFGIYAIRRAGSLVNWGGYPWGGGENDFREVVEKANALVDVAVGHGAGYAVGLRRDGRLRLLNDKMDWIDDETTGMIEDLRDVIAISSSKRNSHTLALINTGEVVGWGWGTTDNPDLDPVPSDLPRDIDRIVAADGFGAVRSQSKGWIFFGANINAERAAANADGCIDISFTGTRTYGLRP